MLHSYVCLKGCCIFLSSFRLSFGYLVLGRPHGNIKMDDYDSGNGLFLMQNTFKVDTQVTVDSADSLWLDVGRG